MTIWLLQQDIQTSFEAGFGLRKVAGMGGQDKNRIELTGMISDQLVKVWHIRGWLHACFTKDVAGSGVGLGRRLTDKVD